MILAEKLMLGSSSGETSKPYLEFRSSTPMTIKPSYSNTGITLQYSLNTITWTNIESKAVTPSSNVIYFRGSATGTKSLFTSETAANGWEFTGATNLEVYGDITMLLQDIIGGNVHDVPLASYCYSYMFVNCASLIIAPKLPSTSLGTHCYRYMFYNCTGLTTAPVLPATTLANSCYSSMFSGCTGLTTAPNLPATVLTDYCYNNMFYGCRNLEIAPSLPATTLAVNCYNNMFYYCLSLTTAPSLPATTLAVNCYNNMFSSCASLTTAPALPATTLASGCYNSMFRGCTSLKLSTTLEGIYDTPYRIPTTGTITGTAGYMDLNSMFSGTGGTFKSTPTINTTYYTENTPV